MEKDKLDFIRGLSKAIHIVHDDGRDIGLKRDEETSQYERKFMDGFSAKLCGNILTISYQSEITMAEIKSKNKFESDIDDKFANIVKAIKKEVKNQEKVSLNLKEIKGSSKIDVTYMNRLRSWVEAKKDYTVGNLDKEFSYDGSVDSDDYAKKIRDMTKKFLELGGNKLNSSSKD